MNSVPLAQSFVGFFWHLGARVNFCTNPGIGYSSLRTLAGAILGNWPYRNANSRSGGSSDASWGNSGILFLPKSLNELQVLAPNWNGSESSRWPKHLIQCQFQPWRKMLRRLIGWKMNFPFQEEVFPFVWWLGFMKIQPSVCQLQKSFTVSEDDFPSGDTDNEFQLLIQNWLIYIGRKCGRMLFAGSTDTVSKWATPCSMEAFSNSTTRPLEAPHQWGAQLPSKRFWARPIAFQDMPRNYFLNELKDVNPLELWGQGKMETVFGLLLIYTNIRSCIHEIFLRESVLVYKFKSPGKYLKSIQPLCTFSTFAASNLISKNLFNIPIFWNLKMSQKDIRSLLHWCPYCGKFLVRVVLVEVPFHQRRLPCSKRPGIF